MEKLFTPKEIGELLSINYRKVLDLIVLGELKAYKIGGVYRISTSSVHQLLDNHVVKTPWNKSR